MRTRHVEFYSDGIRLEGLLQLPDDRGRGRRPIVVLCSGFQGLKEWIPAKLWGPFSNAGYTCFAFDFRGFGTSGGARGRVLPREQVEDVQHAVTFVQQQPEVDPDAVGLLGWGLGGGVVIQTAAEDLRVRAVACLNGVGDAGRAVRDSRPYAEWLAMQDRIAEDRVHRVLTGRSQLAGASEIVPLDPSERTRVEQDPDRRAILRRLPEARALGAQTSELVSGGSAPAARAESGKCAGPAAGGLAGAGRGDLEVSLQSAEAYYAFRPELIVRRISPRPLLIVHGARNVFHPIDEARNLYARAREPKTLIEVPDGHHLDWIQPGHRLYEPTTSQIVEWFLRHLPVEARRASPPGSS